MKRIPIFFILALGVGGIALAQQPSAQDQQKAMEAYMKAGAVTADHAHLKYYVGVWDVTTTMWTFPGTPPQTSKNRYDAALILGGRYVQMKFSGMMMGQPFEGLQIIGFDNVAKKYTTLWIDNTSTSFYLTSGTLDASKKVMTETGNWTDPMTGGATKVKIMTKILGPDEFVNEQYMVLPDGKEFKSMENRCLRKK